MLGLRKDILCHEIFLTLLTTCSPLNQTQGPRADHLVITDSYFDLPTGSCIIIVTEAVLVPRYSCLFRTLCAPSDSNGVATMGRAKQ